MAARGNKRENTSKARRTGDGAAFGATAARPATGATGAGGASDDAAVPDPRRLESAAPEPAHGPEAPLDDPSSVDSATAVAIGEIAASAEWPRVAEREFLEEGPQGEPGPTEDEVGLPMTAEELDHDRIARESETLGVDGIEVTARPTEEPSRPSDGDIAELAYAYYERRGRQPGREVDDWLAAEQELLQMGIEAEVKSGGGRCGT